MLFPVGLTRVSCMLVSCLMLLSQVQGERLSLTLGSPGQLKVSKEGSTCGNFVCISCIILASCGLISGGKQHHGPLVME